ncbi:hypothetical protein ATI61_10856 [Archangium gephyra]|uniref:Uncharacterized protein n=1 Tax=Archangium gephyra TaxID=48 RepID=A0AAC8Q8J8_9BACT|nr:hypothetical protein [Archangium gephyra]AKJ02556.1 Hypothetical protein AA314_04182 [Archangium gephyra]REG28523.1 hypothetical protein ATI61_10856 [Archangium gephyra]
MPDLTASVVIEDWNVDARGKRSTKQAEYKPKKVCWKVMIDHKTREKNPRATQASFEDNVEGNQLPADFLRKRKGTIQLGGQGKVRAAGGTVTFEVTVSLEGLNLPAVGKQTLLVREKGPSILAQDNPPKSAVQARIMRNGLALGFSKVLCDLLQRLCCQESGQKQFHLGDTKGYLHEGEPIMNHGGDGGTGLKQITQKTVGPDLLWDWQENLDYGLKLFNDKLRIAKVHRTQILADPRYKELLENTATWRASQKLPELKIVTIPDYTDEQLADAAIRANNGVPKISNPGDDTPLGRNWHEFTLAVETVNLPNPDPNKDPKKATVPLRVLTLQKEKGPDGKRSAEATWVRVDVSTRPKVGDPDYVNNVKSRSPTC